MVATPLKSPVVIDEQAKSCKNCVYHRNQAFHCASPTSPLNTANLALDLDPIFNKYPGIDEEEAKGLGWAEHCTAFFPSPNLENECSGEEEYYQDIDQNCIDAGYEPF